MTQQKELPLRSEVNQEDTWDLRPIFKDDDAWEASFSDIEKQLDIIETYQGKLSQSAALLLEALKFRDDLWYRLGHLYVYAHLSFDADTTNATYQAMNSRIQGLGTKVGARFSFFDTELLSAKETTIRAFLDELEPLSLYKHEFELLFVRRPHILSEREERLLASASEVMGASSNTFGMLNNADIKFPDIAGDGGETITLSHGRYALLMESSDREVRKNAFTAMHDTYAGFENTFASTLSGQIKTDNLLAALRGYDSARHRALSRNHIDEKVFDALIEGVHQNIDLLHQYVELRKDTLQLEDIQMYDIYVPMVDDVDLKFTYQEAQEIIIEALSVLGDEYVSVLRRAFSERWIDVVENKGKRSGAYSSGTYGTNPYILLNWQENIDNVFTLAHELGHSVHSYFTRTYQPLIYGDYSIFLAEVASTTNENLLLDYLLGQYNDPKIRAYLLNHYLDSVKGTVFRQAQFAQFEHLIHQADQSGTALTAQFLNDQYYALNQFYYGKAISHEKIKHEWARIPHFYYNYYVYQYATGFSAATLFSELIVQGGDTRPYLDYLKAGSSDYPIEVLKKAGVDMTDSSVLQATFDSFRRRIQELREILV